MEEELEVEGIEKQEAVGYLKSKINLQQGCLFLTPSRVVLRAGKSTVGGLGLLGVLLSRWVGKKVTVFDLPWAQVASIQQGKHGFQKNVLEICDHAGATFRVLVKDYEEWDGLLKAKLTPPN